MKLVRTLGIDTAKWQGGMDYVRAEDSGIRFNVAKATEGAGYVDPKYREHRDASFAEGMLVGAYHFFWCISDPKVQARHYFDTVNGLTNWGPVLDFETWKPSKDRPGMAPDQALAQARVFVEEVERLFQRRCWIYTYPGFWPANPPKKERDFFGARPLWIAQYNLDNYPAIPNTWEWAHAYQFDGDGGKVLPCGKDSDFNWFGGSYDDLIRYCASDVLPETPPYPNLGSLGATIAPAEGAARALKLLGFADLSSFQASAGLVVDGKLGPKSTAALKLAMRAAWST